jgi:hypothetical protein
MAVRVACDVRSDPARKVRVRARRTWLGIALACGLAACAPDADDAPGPGAATPAPDAPSTVHQPHHLILAAVRIVSFLRGEAEFDEVFVADTVALYVAPEGGGMREEVPRELLRDRAAWRVGEYGFVPPAESTILQTEVGTHYACFEQQLSSRYPHLARLPHVGARLEPPGADNCLQIWNLTLVFDPVEQPAKLVAAVYDQWEW